MKAIAALEELVSAHALRTRFDAAVEAEVAQWQANPGIDAPDLVDRTGLPFITIDNADSRDLDQAMCIERDGDGYVVWYALADASYYVPMGSALFAEALARGATYYLPGFCVPMLPRPLSEDLVSLNANVDRRALITRTNIDSSGVTRGTDFERARIHSRAKLTYDGVQQYVDGAKPALDGQDFTETLDLLVEVGRLRIVAASERDVVRYDDDYVEIGFADDTRAALKTTTKRRNDVERYNEQVSLLCNMEAAHRLRQGASEPYVQAVFRVHDAPPPSRVDELVEIIDGLIDAHHVDRDVWRWRRDDGQSLAAYMRGLPSDRPRLAKAIRRQALVINQRSTFAVEVGRHHALGAEEYSRISAPMREIVGIFTHKELLESLAGHGTEDEALQAEVVEAANRSKTVQKKLSKASYGIALDQLFVRDLALPKSSRPARRGTVMGRGGSRIYVELDDPRLDVKVYDSDCDVSVGAAVDLTITGRAGTRWTFEAKSAPDRVP